MTDHENDADPLDYADVWERSRELANASADRITLEMVLHASRRKGKELAAYLATWPRVPDTGLRLTELLAKPRSVS
jgi:hypothetical protein